LSTETPLIDITHKATEQLTSLINEHKDEGQLLRIMVMPAQNGGVQYALGIEKEAQQTDICIKVDNIEVLIEKDCVPLVEGAKIDYIDDLMRSGFIISNPNMPSGGGGGCGCGGGGCGGGGAENTGGGCGGGGGCACGGGSAENTGGGCGGGAENTGGGGCACGGGSAENTGGGCGGGGGCACGGGAENTSGGCGGGGH
jgi:iron-sulfur cluster assembly accessory protein